MAEGQRAGRKLHFGAKAIATVMGNDDVPKVNRLLRQNLVPGAMKWGRQYVLDEETFFELVRAKARGAA